MKGNCAHFSYGRHWGWVTSDGIEAFRTFPKSLPPRDYVYLSFGSSSIPVPITYFQRQQWWDEHLNPQGTTAVMISIP